jgi:3-hydroxymyristoyl/3-hydroxydecanoyl-(acyl carrier protein) dehydratase
MTDHFSAFSFVDRISVFEPGVRARGTFAIPLDIEAFPVSLVSEAVGQLAAWTAMAHIGFRGRPVAALALETRLTRGVIPGQTLDLVVEIDDCDDDAVAYHGHARVAGAPVIEVRDCLGPMLPVAEFDDPVAMAAQLELLTGDGAVPRRLRAVPALRAQRRATQSPGVVEGLLEVPAAAPFFRDHFPRRPVLPAALLFDAQLALAGELLTECGRWPAGAPIVPQRVTRFKLRAFTPPGATMQLRAEILQNKASDDMISMELSASAEGKPVATARAEFSPRSVA